MSIGAATVFVSDVIMGVALERSMTWDQGCCCSRRSAAKCKTLESWTQKVHVEALLVVAQPDIHESSKRWNETKKLERLSFPLHGVDDDNDGALLQFQRSNFSLVLLQHQLMPRFQRNKSFVVSFVLAHFIRLRFFSPFSQSVLFSLKHCPKPTVEGLQFSLRNSRIRCPMSVCLCTKLPLETYAPHLAVTRANLTASDSNSICFNLPVNLTPVTVVAVAGGGTQSNIDWEPLCILNSTNALNLISNMSDRCLS